jgi:hypothetical protein
VIACAVPLGLWGAHNKRIHGAWVLSSASSGVTLWEGVGEIPNSYGYTSDDSAANRMLAAHGYEWASVDGNAFMTREYLRAWREHPMFVARGIVLRCGRILFHSDRLQPLFFGRLRELLDAVGVAALLVAVWLKRRDPVALFVLTILPLYGIGSIGLMHYEPRYVRYVPIGFVLALLLVVEELRSRTRTRAPQLANIVAVCVLLAMTAYTARELRAVRAAATAPTPPSP